MVGEDEAIENLIFKFVMHSTNAFMNWIKLKAPEGLFKNSDWIHHGLPFRDEELASLEFGPQNELGHPLYQMVFTGMVPMVHRLLECGARIDALGGRYGNALQAAVWRNDENLVMILLERGADVNAPGGPYGSALQVAVWEDHENLVRLLVERGADVNKESNVTGSALLMVARESNSLSIMQLLLNHGADVDAQDADLCTALILAAGKPFRSSMAQLDDWRVAAVRMLLDHGANIHTQSIMGENALTIATRSNNYATVQLLLEHGANARMEGNHLHGLLEIAVSREAWTAYLSWHFKIRNTWRDALPSSASLKNAGIVRSLLEYGADPNEHDEIYGNVLQAAAVRSTESEAIVALLLEHGADFNVNGGYFGNALQAPVVFANEAAVRVMLEHGANANARGGRIGTALQVVAASSKRKGAISVVRTKSLKNHNTIRRTLSKGHSGTKSLRWPDRTMLATVKREDNDGVIVDLLLEAGADVNTTSGRWGSALQAAAR